MKKPDVKDYDIDTLEGMNRFRNDWGAWLDLQDRAEFLVRDLLRNRETPIDLLAQAMASELHRTEQQHAGRTIKNLLAAMATLDYDDRNEATVRMAQAASAAIDDVALPFI